MDNLRTLRTITGLIELFLAIPFLGWLIYAATAPGLGIFMFVLHGVTLYVTLQARENYIGSLLGMLAAVVGIVPVLGWILHLVAAVLLLAGRYIRMSGGRPRIHLN